MTCQQPALQDMPSDTLLKPAEAAQRLKMSVRRLQLLARDRRIGCVRDGDRFIRFHPDHLRDWWESHNHPPA